MDMARGFALLVALTSACGGSARGASDISERDWVGEGGPAPSPVRGAKVSELAEIPLPRFSDADVAGSAASLRLEDDGDLFRNTYYDFPSEGEGPKEASIFDPSCRLLASVTRDFHEKLCVQGSGKLASGAVVSFAKRGCSCAAVCPRTSQQICYERLDPSRFPTGRGASGRPIQPLSTLAVDSSVLPLGTTVFIPEFVGLPRADGTFHDGCFVAEDRGIRVVGRHVDVFTGDPSMTARWNGLYPSNRGVHVLRENPRCPPAPRRKSSPAAPR